MRGTLRFGRLFGLDIRLAASWLVLLALVTCHVAFIFRGWHPTWALGPSLVLAAAAAGVLFVSLLVHELAHAFVGRGVGMPIRQVRLSLFGGVGDGEPDPRSPAAEFWTAIAGPVLSLAIGTVVMLVTSRTFGSILEPAAAMARLSPFQTVVFWIGPMNMALGLLHLLPGLPLDGGRVLHAGIWKATGDHQRATVIAATIGSVLGVIFFLLGVGMALGIDLPVLGHGLGGLWVALIGSYLYVGAERSLDTLPPRHGRPLRA
jgi:Zn-dependent protease